MLEMTKIGWKSGDLEDLGLVGGVNIKLNSLEIGYKDMSRIQIVQDRMWSSCEHGNEPPGSVKGGVG
jgi:hypothetical protein